MTAQVAASAAGAHLHLPAALLVLLSLLALFALIAEPVAVLSRNAVAAVVLRTSAAESV